MKTVTFYLQQEGIIYTVNGTLGKKQGVLSEKEVEQFLSDNPPGVLNVVLPKPELTFRKLEFPFANRRNIKLVMPQELENILPETPENYHYYFEFNPAGKGKTAVNVYAVKNTVCSFWKNLVKKYNSKVFFFSDTVLFHLFLKQHTAEKNHIGIYGIRNYLLINMTEDGTLSGSYSYDFKTSEAGRIKELLSDVLSRKELRVFVFAEEGVKKEIEVPAERLQEIRSLPQIEKRFLFHNLLTVNPYKKPLQLKKLHHGKKFPVYDIVLLSVFLIVSVLSLSPYFRMPAKQRRINELSRKMDETFLAACPEVTRIVNPLVQIKEKIMERKSIRDVISGYPSVLKIMADITALFPENTTASIDQFTVAGNTLIVSGSTGSLKSLETIKEKIEGSKNFTIVNMGTISFDAKDRVNFNITLGITE